MSCYMHSLALGGSVVSPLKQKQRFGTKDRSSAFYNTQARTHGERKNAHNSQENSQKMCSYFSGFLSLFHRPLLLLWMISALIVKVTQPLWRM